MTAKRKVLFVVGVLLMALGIGCLSFLGVRSLRDKADSSDIHDIAFRESSTPFPTASLTQAPDTEPSTALGTAKARATETK